MVARGNGVVPQILSARLIELSTKTNLPQPYDVTDKITVYPPTKKRAEQMREASMQLVVHQSLLGEATRRTGTARPKQADFDRTADYDAAVAEWTSEIENLDTTMKTLSEQISADNQAWERAFFGDAYDVLMKFASGMNDALWNAFVSDIREQFLPDLNQQPDDGRCPRCGQVVDEESAGKAPSSPTSSTTTGTPSNPTSPSTATPTPETGSEALSLGTSS